MFRDAPIVISGIEIERRGLKFFLGCELFLHRAYSYMKLRLL